MAIRPTGRLQPDPGSRPPPGSRGAAQPPHHPFEADARRQRQQQRVAAGDAAGRHVARQRAFVLQEPAHAAREAEQALDVGEVEHFDRAQRHEPDERSDAQPLGAVGTVAHMVRSERAFGRRVPPSGIAEIDHFAQDFNALLSELEGWHAGLTSENAELARLATHDPLTGLGNRALFERMVGEAIGQAVRSGASFAVLFLDVDGFKAINDQHGHDAGDAALREVAERLRASVRHVDSAFRMGGDEFAVLLGPLFNRAHVDAVIERIELAMGQPLLIPGFGDASLGLSIGVALYPDDGVSPQDLLRRADAKMYKHKHDRRTNFEGGMNDA